MRDFDYISMIHRELVGELSELDAVVLDQWKEDNEDNLAIYQDTVEIWNLMSNYATPTLDINVTQALEDQLTRIRKEPLNQEKNTQTKRISIRLIQWVMRIAAALVFVLAATFIIRSGDGGVNFSSGDEMQYVQLTDGSNIWLDKNSTLTADDSFGDGSRKVKITGKAFFDITRDEFRPFIINTNKLTVSVLGTSFTIDASFANPVVEVKSGKVEVKTELDSKIITKGLRLETNEIGNLIQSEVDINDVFGWANDDLSFKDAPLSQVLAELGVHFNINFVYKGVMDLNNCPFTSKSLADTQLDDILEILKLTYDMNIDRGFNEEIRILKIRCRK